MDENCDHQRQPTVIDDSLPCSKILEPKSAVGSEGNLANQCHFEISLFNARKCILLMV